MRWKIRRRTREIDLNHAVDEISQSDELTGEL